MSESLNARRTRHWTVKFRGRYDSKYNPCWRKHHFHSYVREYALTTAYHMIGRMAEDSAMVDFQRANRGWSLKFLAWCHGRRGQYLKEAHGFLSEDATNDKVDEEIQNELGVWND